MKNLLCIAVVLLVTIATYAQDCNWNDEAQRHFTRATAAVKEAKNDADYLDAIEEFKKVLESAPDCPDIYYNIALCYDKSSNSGRLKDISGCEQAISYLKKYLALKPNAPDKQAVQNRIEELGYRHDKLNKLLPEMVYVEGGTFRMDCIGKDCENKGHQVTLSSFYIGKYEITQAQWGEVMGTTFRQQCDKASEKHWGSLDEAKIMGEGDNYPMYHVSWDDAQEFISKLNAITGKNYRLPTEAEWEYAARGGIKSQGYKYSGSNNLKEVMGYSKSWDILPIGSKLPNELGIHDMSGSVCEWCNDWYDKYPSLPQRDPMGPSSGSSRVFRDSFSWGGGGNSKFYLTTNRSKSSSNNRISIIGFRLACSSE